MAFAIVLRMARRLNRGMLGTGVVVFHQEYNNEVIYYPRYSRSHSRRGHSGRNGAIRCLTVSTPKVQEGGGVGYICWSKATNASRMIQAYISRVGGLKSSIWHTAIWFPHRSQACVSRVEEV